jgi:hypothetical protein
MPLIQSMAFMQRSVSYLAAIAMFALLAGCEGEVTMDLATEAPADPNVSQVVANVRGLEFTTSGGGTKTLEFSDSQQLDFMDYTDDSNVLRLFTNEQLPEGNYTGVRLLFDEDTSDDAFVTLQAGTQFPMNLADGEAAPLSFSVEDRENNSESFTLMFDLRQSLSFDDDNDEYTLTPVLRTVETSEAGRFDGDVSVTCPAGDTLSRGAVYLFQGEDVTPDDIDGDSIEPFATAPIITATGGGSFFYSLRFLPEGDYTLGVSCVGNDDDPVENNDLEFRNVINVSLDNSENATLDLP